MKIAFFDIDGTLINAQNGMMQPDEQTKQALYAFNNRETKSLLLLQEVLSQKD